jgi:hypothetical protein
MSQDDHAQDTKTSPMRASARLGLSPRRSRPPITPNPVNVQSWVFGAEEDNRLSKSDGNAPLSIAHRQSGGSKLDARIDEDPFQDYLDYESDRDYLSETDSVTVDDDEPIETIEFGSDHHVPSDQIKRKPSRRDPNPPNIDMESFPNSPSPCSPILPTTLPYTLKTGRTDAPSVYSRPSWRASQYPMSSADPFGWKYERPSVPRAEIHGRMQSAKHTNQADHYVKDQFGLNDNGAMTEDPDMTAIGYGHDDPAGSRAFAQTLEKYAEPQLVPLPRMQQHNQSWASPVPVSTAQIALGLPLAQIGSFGSVSSPPQPVRHSPYSTLQRFWITTGPFIVTVTSLIAAILTVMTTTAYGSKIGSIWSVPNRMFSLTAAGESPGDVKLGLEGWCLGER